MEDAIRTRVVRVAQYVIENKATVRAAAHEFGCSKSTVWLDLNDKLQRVDPQLYKAVRKVQNINLAERGLRGGNALKQRRQAERLERSAMS